MKKPLFIIYEGQSINEDELDLFVFPSIHRIPEVM